MEPPEKLLSWAVKHSEFIIAIKTEITNHGKLWRKESRDLIKANCTLLLDSVDEIGNLITEGLIVPIVRESNDSNGNEPLALSGIKADIHSMCEEFKRVSAEVSELRGEMKSMKTGKEEERNYSYARVAAGNSVSDCRPAQQQLIRSISTATAIPIPAKSYPTLCLQTNSANVNVLDEFRRNVSFKTQTFAPVTLKKYGGNRLRIEFESQSQLEIIQKLCDKIPTLKTDNPRKRLPLLMVSGIHKTVPKDDLVDLICSQNPEIGAEADISLKFIKANKNEFLYNAVVTVDPVTRKRLLEKMRVNVESQRVHVRDFSPFTQCFNCLKYGHIQTKCPATNAVCALCGKEGHSGKDCIYKENEPNCRNCQEYNEKNNTGKKHPVNHKGTDLNCECILAAIRSIQLNTDYGQ